MTIIDGDTVDITNINRQLPALHSTVNQPKVELVYARLKDINPNLDLTAINEFLTPERMESILTKEKFDYVLDCIDSVSPKLSLILAAKRNKIKIVSAMGAGGKTDPSKVMVRDISKTNNCFLAKQIRKRLRKEKINKGIKCVFSTELQKEDSLKMTDGANFKKSFMALLALCLHYLVSTQQLKLSITLLKRRMSYTYPKSEKLKSKKDITTLLKKENGKLVETLGLFLLMQKQVK